MPPELLMLSFAIVLGLIQLVLAAHFSTLQRGFQWNMGSRDRKAPDLTGVAGRLDRAFKNFMETFPFFAAAVLAGAVLKRVSSVGEIGAEIYLVARVLHLVIYAAGTPYIRTPVWLVSMVGLVMVLSVLFV